jgi:hypothetical protein
MAKHMQLANMVLKRMCKLSFTEMYLLHLGKGYLSGTWLSSGMLHYVVWYILTNVSEKLTASIIRVSQYLPDYTVQHPRRQPSFILIAVRT